MSLVGTRPPTVEEVEQYEAHHRTRESVNIEETSVKVQQEEKEDGLDMDEGMMMAGLSMFENGF